MSGRKTRACNNGKKKLATVAKKPKRTATNQGGSAKKKGRGKVVSSPSSQDSDADPNDSNAVATDNEENATDNEENANDSKVEAKDSKLQAGIKCNFPKIAPKKDPTDTKDPWDEKINKCIKEHLWRVTKFIKGKGVRTKNGNKVYDLLGLKEMGYPRKEWVPVYESNVNRLLNAHRTYVVAEIKKRLEAYWLANDKTLPSIDRFKACLMRTLAPDNEDDMALFTFWVDKILVSACGNKWDWCKSVRYAQKISEAGYQLDDEGKIDKDNMNMNGSTEAFAFLVIENYYAQMPAQWQWKLDNPGDNLPPQCKEETRVERGYQKFPATKWTESHQGQQTFGGWDAAAQALFKEYKEANEAVRLKDISKKLEMDVLAKLKVANGITGDGPVSKKKVSKASQVTDFDCCDF